MLYKFVCVYIFKPTFQLLLNGIYLYIFICTCLSTSLYTTILQLIECRVYRECMRLLSRIVFYLLQDGLYIYVHICMFLIFMRIFVVAFSLMFTLTSVVVVMLTFFVVYLCSSTNGCLMAVFVLFESLRLRPPTPEAYGKTADVGKFAAT